MGSRIGDPYC